jgi:hypothetical protein
MEFAVIAASAAGFALVSLWIYLQSKAREAERSTPTIPEWIDGLSVERYWPMLRLLTDQDLRFLRAQPGATSAMVSRLRAQRHRTFQEYLRHLRADFRHAGSILWRLSLRTGSRRPGLVGTLLRRRLAFAASLFLVRCRVLLYRCGLGGVDVTRLVVLFDSMRTELYAAESVQRVVEPSGLADSSLSTRTFGPQQAIPPR